MTNFVASDSLQLRYSGSVEDETGTVDASYAALCQMGPVMLKDGDHVTIEGHFLGTLDVRLVTKR